MSTILQSSNRPHQDNKPVRILIADDDRDIVDSLKSVLMLENFPLEILSASNETEARNIAETESIDIALLDIRLGNKSGLDLVPLLKNRNQHVQCIIMTGYPDIQYAVNAIRFGADEFLRKPIDAEHLVSTVQRYIKYQSYARERDQAESWFRAVFQNSDHMLFITDHDGRVVQINQKASAVCGVDQDTAIGSPIWTLSPWGSRKRPSSIVRTALESGFTEHSTRLELDITPGQVSISSIELLVRALPGQDGMQPHFLVEGRDITRHREKEKTLQQRALHDELTALPNRTQLLNTLSNLCSISMRRNRTISVLFIDLDNFKQVNDSFGHKAGDEVLKQTAERLNKCVRGEDTVARYSGDEFIAVINETGSNEVTRVVADRILRDMSEPFEVDGESMSLSVSIGIARFPDHGNTAESLINNADEAMYIAKNDGKNRYHFLG